MSLNKQELKKMLSELNSDLRRIAKEEGHFKEKRRSYRKKSDTIDRSIARLSTKKSLINDNITKLKSLISASAIIDNIPD